MDAYGNIDYMRPGAKSNDYRTSTYRGHVKLADHIDIPPPITLEDVCPKYRIKAQYWTGQSECKREYTWKPSDPLRSCNPTLNTILRMRPYEERFLRNAPKQMQAYGSIYKYDFQGEPKYPEEPPPHNQLFNFGKAADAQPSNRLKPGYAKLLDPSATTTNLAHVEYSFSDLGIGTPDTITFWNWKRYKYNVVPVKENMCDKYRAQMCPKRYNEYRTMTKSVPHAGQTSMTKTSFCYESPISFDISHISNMSPSDNSPDLKCSTENMMYGTGDSSRRYVP